MNGRAVRAGLAGAVAVLALAGCGGGNDSDSTAGGVAAVAPGQPAPAGEQAADAGSGSAGEPAPGRNSTSGLKLEPALIRTAEIDVVVEDVPAKAGEAAALARAAGGAIAGDDRTGGGRSARATMVLKVPPARMDALVDQVGRLGEERRRSSTSQDVTSDVADVESRVATMQASIARVRAILSRADKIGDVVAVEGELSRRVTELESLQARQRALAGQVGYATVTVQLSTRSEATVLPAEEERSGFLGGLEDGWSAFTATVRVLLVIVGAVLPFLLVLAPVAYGLWWAHRRRRSTAAPSPAPAPAP